MNYQQRWRLRLDILSELVAHAPSKLGRTALMKLAYFLQTLKNVPLEYNFRLYTYGPFDSDLLDDVGELETLGALKAELVRFEFGKGYGYEFIVGPARDNLEKLTKNESKKYRTELDWVLGEFGGKSASELELISTIIFGDQECVRTKKMMTHSELARTVKEIKPRFSEEHIDRSIKELNAKGILVGSN